MPSSRLNLTGLDPAVPSVASALGAVLHDDAGGRWVDWEAGVWCAGLGHQHPAVVRAVSEQLSAVGHVGYRWTHPVVEQAATRLAEVAGLPDGRVVFLSSGSEAVELAIRLAHAVTGRQRLARIAGNYLAAYGAARGPGWTELTERTVEHRLGPDVAAFVLEPGNASGTVDLPSRDLVESVARGVQNGGGLLVVDEVTTGFGRTGRWFGYQHYAVRPDIVAVGKGAGNGYPVSAVVVSEEVAARLPPDFRHAQSHQDDPAAAAAVLAVIDTMQRDGLVERSAILGQRLRTALLAVAGSAGEITEVRGRGLMCAVSLRPVDQGGPAAAEVQRRLAAAGHLVGANPARNCLRLYPPLVIGEEQIDALAQALRGALA
ncbi:MAG: aminotransferase class III-fold pyridoxal phosphate-dependent enzyme [Propionicimonas sp.]|nr:aminotransferase class III-fold pyridoxal phosphate-dependent enzyme [Propionicimonas sp.]